MDESRSLLSTVRGKAMLFCQVFPDKTFNFQENSPLIFRVAGVKVELLKTQAN
jgi:hypothetical protein